MVRGEMTHKTLSEPLEQMQNFYDDALVWVPVVIITTQTHPMYIIITYWALLLCAATRHTEQPLQMKELPPVKQTHYYHAHQNLE